MKPSLKILPLGGLGEIGMNIMVIQYGAEAILVDCGVMFSDENLPGIDLVVPDFQYLFDPGVDLKAVVLTHGHEDHIGALPFLLRERMVPVYGSRFTLGLVREKLREHELLNEAELNLIKEKDRRKLGPFDIEFIEMAHSIADALAMAIRTPEGLVIHTGDFKLDENPTDGRKTDLKRFEELGKEGVLLLLSDSTNVEHSGRSPSESVVRADLEKLMSESKGWTIVACFASHIPRLRQVFEIAHRLGKRIHLAGRTMIQNVGIARDQGQISFQDSFLVEEGEVEKIPRDQLVVLSTGTQGEVRSALARMALDQHSVLRLKENDTVILSSRFIPGNERAIFETMNNLYRRGAVVHTTHGALIHVSGHAYREDLADVLRAVKPKYFVPVHGEYRHLVKHIQLAQEVGVGSARTFLLEDGHGLQIQDGKALLLEPLDLREAVVDGKELIDIGSHILKDRKHLSATGMIVAVVILDRHSGDVIQGPELFAKGMITEDDEGDFLGDLREELGDMVESLDSKVRTSDSAIQEEIRVFVRRFFKNRTSRRPVVIPIVLEV